MFDKFLNKHMKIERMIITCAIMVFAIFAVIGYDGVTLYSRSRVVLSDEPILEGVATTTVTGTQFYIDNIYGSEDGTQVMVVLSGDLSTVSYVADTYKVYLAGKSAETYSGGVYVFGDLGLLCVYVTSIEGFPAEKTELILRCEASTGSNSLDDDFMSFFINLGAKNITKVPFMDDAGLNVELMAKSAFFADEDNEVRTMLYEKQSAMVSARVALLNLRSNMSRLGIELPVAPEWMICHTTDENGNPTDTIDYVDNRENTGSEYIATSYVFAGASDFDWENTTRLDNYADIAGISAEDIDSTLERPDSQDAVPEYWYKSDGSVITSPTSSESALINQYAGAITAYYNAKVDYQDTVATLITRQNRYIESITDYTSSVGDGTLTGMKR